MNSEISAKIVSVNQNAGQEWNRFVDEHLVNGISQFHGRPFLAEELREVMEPMINQAGLTAPDGRAWGHVLRRAKASNLVAKVGHAPAKSSHYTPKTLWCSLR